MPGASVPGARKCEGRGPTLVVHPTLHSSGFGNQLGMLLQHLSIAALSGARLVVPPVHVPVEHRRSSAVPEQLHADQVFNFTSLLPLVNATALRLVPPLQWLARTGRKMGTFESLSSRKERDGEPWPSSPIARLSLDSAFPDALSMVASLRGMGGCRGGCAGDASRCAEPRFVRYCHTIDCRAHTRHAYRSCRRRRKRKGWCGATAGSQQRGAPPYVRLRNNYYFAHKLPAVLCDRGPAHCATCTGLAPGAATLPPAAAARAARSRADGSVAGLLPWRSDGTNRTALFEWRMVAAERELLSRLQLSGEIRAAAAEIAAALGEYACVHVRLHDASGGGSGGGREGGSEGASEGGREEGSDGGRKGGSVAGRKGLGTAETIAALRRLAPRLRAAGARAVYVASNRPNAVRAVGADLAGALAAAASTQASSPAVQPARPLRLLAWHDVRHRGAVPTGLRAALIEHEVCATAPRGFAGSQFSTWANLIGARRWLAGRPNPYIDLTSAAAVPRCGRSADGPES